MYLLTTPIACAISSFVHTIAYINLPIRLAYDTFAIFSSSYLFLGDAKALRLLYDHIWVDCGENDECRMMLAQFLVLYRSNLQGTITQAQGQLIYRA